MTAARLPELGIRLSGALAPQRAIELAQAADSAGFASLWFAENPFQRGILPTVGACAAATGRVRVGVGVVNPFSRHPTLIAMEFAALDELAEGRAVLGIGSGIAASVRRMGFAADRPVTAVREAIAIVRGMLAGDGVDHRGRVFRVEGARLGFAPHRANLPIYMAAAGKRALLACGEAADGLIVSNLTPPRSTERVAAIVAAAASKAGRAMPRIVQYVPCAVGADGHAAHASVKGAIGEMLKSFWPFGDDWPPAKRAIAAESGIAAGEFAVALDRLRRGEDAAAVLDERFVAAFAIAGTPDDCLRQAARYRDAGVDELALTFAGGDPAAQIAALARAVPA